MTDSHCFGDGRKPEHETREEEGVAARVVCVAHNRPMLDGEYDGRQRCDFYVPELGVSEDYGCYPSGSVAASPSVPSPVSTRGETK